MSTAPAVQWAGIILVNRQGELLLNLRDSSRALYPGCWDLVGGTLEAGETPEACIRRELREETGEVLGEVEPLGEFDVPLADRSFGRLHVFLAGLDNPASTLLLGEGVGHRFFSPSQLDALELPSGTAAVLQAFVASQYYPQVLSR